MNSSGPDCEGILLMLAASAPPPLGPTSVGIFSTLLVVFTIITLTGNGIVIYSIAKVSFLRKRQNVHVASLAFADMTLAYAVMPSQTYELWNKSWDLPGWLCTVRNTVEASLAQVSVYNLLVLAGERYIAICYPFIYPKLSATITICTVILTWLVPAISQSILYFSGWQMLGLEDIFSCLINAGVCAYLVNPNAIYFIQLSIIFIPMIMIFYLYGRIYATAKRHARSIRSFIVSEEDRKRNLQISGNTKAAKTLSIVVGAFFFCWLPVSIISFIDNESEYSIVPPVLVQATVWLAYLNSMLNPFLYYIFNQEFKNAFRIIFHCKVATGQFTSDAETA